MDILVVSGCSGDKAYDHAPIGCREIDSASREDLIREYPDYVASASEMYEGEEHGYVRRAVSNFRGYADVSWRILSAGYGLLDEDDEIVAYDCTLSDIEDVQERAIRMGYDVDDLTHDETRRIVAREIGIPSSIRGALGSGYDLAFFTLSTPYLIAVSEALQDIQGKPTVFGIASNGAMPYIGAANWVPATDEVRSELESNWYRLRGEILEMLSMEFNEENMKSLIDDPATISSQLPN